MSEPDTDTITRHNRWLTVPNTLSVIRFLGSWLMLWFAFRTQPNWVAGMFLFLTATDWLDGKLAVLLDQRSKVGPRLDTIADVTVYACLLGALLQLPHFSLRNESPYLTAAIGSYAVSVLYSLYKFRCIPSYHTRAAKTCWLFILVGVLSLFLQWSIWPLRIALAAVTLTNVEAILITRLAKEPLSDIEHFGLVNKPGRNKTKALRDQTDRSERT